jgi:hypothetical protein
MASNTFGIISIILAILAIFFAPLILAILAIIFGLIGLSQDRDKTLATIGLIIGIVIIILLFMGVLVWAMWRIVR